MRCCKLFTVLLGCCLIWQIMHCGKGQSVWEFHASVQAEAANTIKHSPGADNRNPHGSNGPAAHKKALAERIVQGIKGVESSDKAVTIADLGLIFTIVVWEQAGRPGASRYLTYGKTTQETASAADAPLKFGARPLCRGLKAAKYSFPGIGSPAASGASLFVSEAMQDGVVMSCMIFYMDHLSPEKGKVTKMLRFEGAIEECYKQELKDTGLNEGNLRNPIDLDRLASCMWKASEYGKNSHHWWKGVAAVTAYNLLDNHNSPHPDIGIWAPEGNIALEHATFAVPTVDKTSVEWVLVYFFTVLV